MSAARTLLIRALHKHLVPALAERGFVPIPLLSDEQKGREVRFSFPLGRLRRVTKDGSFELVEIQLDKRGTPKFRLNLGVVPPNGIDHPVKHLEQGEVCVHFLSYYAELCSWPFFMKWFSVPISASESEVSKVVNRVAGIIPEAEAWFATGKAGPHVRRVGRL